jgi:hypothetical protein
MLDRRFIIGDLTNPDIFQHFPTYFNISQHFHTFFNSTCKQFKPQNKKATQNTNNKNGTNSVVVLLDQKGK